MTGKQTRFVTAIFPMNLCIGEIVKIVLVLDWPNSLDCTDLNQCGVHRDAELCRLCYSFGFGAIKSESKH